MRNFLTDEEVEVEIERLRTSKYVKLARREQRVQYKRRQFLYGLRNLEKRGKQLDAMGATIETMESMLQDIEDIEGGE